MKRLIIVATTAMMLFASSVNATKNIYAESVSVSEVVSIHDADSFRANIKQWQPIVGDNISVRLSGIDAPEIRGGCELEKKMAQEAREYTVTALTAADRIELRNVRRGKYFRLIADVYLDGSSLSERLLAAGHARPYDGGTRQSWCG